MQLPVEASASSAAELERVAAHIVTSWDAAVLGACRERFGDDEAIELLRQWAVGVPLEYRASVPPPLVAEDMELAATLFAAPDAPEPVLTLYDAPVDEARTWRLRLYRTAPATLSQLLPVASDLGVEITDERAYVLTGADGRTLWLYDIGARVPRSWWPSAAGASAAGASAAGADTCRARFQEAFAAAWAGRVESDALSELVLAAGLTWRQVAVVRALVQYLRQAGLPYTLEYVARTLIEHATVTHGLVDLFEARLDPRSHGGAAEREVRVSTAGSVLGSAIDAVERRDADRILRSLHAAVLAVLRTNVFQIGDDGRRADHLADHLVFKIDPAQIIDLPDPRPTYEIWVHSPRMEGVHLRFGSVARGGLRWSDRREDFRTEILGLVKAQVVKNSVIVPGGAKGGFVAKRLPDPAHDRQASWDEGVACYRTFIGGILDITDNLRADGDREVVEPPADVVRYDGDDPYLVVAADKGTASFSDLANEISTERGFWLGDAFASGGCRGYDHKAMGVTAKGAWESVRRHFRELSIDPQTTEITVTGIGDMSGDVFGNAMLLSHRIRLVAAFDHRHIFLDPDPDPATSYAERARLFALPRSSWADYDSDRLSPGGGVHPRHAKSIPITPEVADRLGLPADTTSLGPDEVVRSILTAPVDLLWNGGIGTYVKASTEQHAEAGDKANDTVRVNATRVRAQVIGEGGNLGLTQRGRVEAAHRGVRLNTDAVDNSAGVDCSDHEVNIKIMLDRLVADGVLGPAERNDVLLRMTDDVLELVLANNDAQNRILSDERHLAPVFLAAHRRLIESLESAGQLDRELEALPTDAELERRARDGAGLTTPELSVLLAHAKISLAHSVIASDLPDEPWAREVLSGYFPRELRERFGDRLGEHPLRREIVATVLVNAVVDRGGITVAHRALEETGCEPADVVRAAVVADRVFGLGDLTTQVSGLDGQVPAAVQSQMRQEQRRLLDRTVRWLLERRGRPVDVLGETRRFAATVAAYADTVPGLLRGQDREYVDTLATTFTAAGVEEAEAQRTAGLLYVFPLLDIVEIAEATGLPVGRVTTTWFLLSERYGFDALLTRVSALARGDRWQVQARAGVRGDLYDVLQRFTTTVLSFAAERAAHDGDGQAPDELAVIELWEALHPDAVTRARQALADVEAADRADLGVLTVALRMIRTVIERA
ncbi:NAD-glutamate dehydrogenase domain-containing protein [Nocardioides sp.]|uniref:NAD-glutamate dehydrogenase domain-containing protein n=1 Tax=Nocardioides sp. TaxID=35761 RepID=UPI002734335A|nr:NAD-glutamate dehydrogenase domain-containing protein [Nocardioides sp.]MDP3892861.1 NAD-glutamate dehydrogenase [Nocardioides sp.]